MDKNTDRLINNFLYLYLFLMIATSILIYPTLSVVSVILLIAGTFLTLFLFYQKNKFKKLINIYIAHKLSDVETAGKSSYKTFPVSILIIHKKNFKIKWCNEEFTRTFTNHESIIDVNTLDLIPELKQENLKNHYTSFPIETEIGENIYRIFAYSDVSDNEFLCLYFINVTEDAKMRNLYETTKPIVSIISIDNYDELLRNTTDTEKSIIVAAINTRLNAWATEANGIFKSFDRDRYIFIFANSEIDEYVTHKFPILDSIREIQTTEGISATLSIGIGRDGETLHENYEHALNAVDMALSRGGDQVVIKNKYTFDFFGGASKEIEKRTKVKSRVVANALNQIIKDAEDVYIMGHQISDYDSLGSCVGMCAAVRAAGKPVKIVIDLERTSAKPLIDKLLQNEVYKDIFISPDEALIKLLPGSLLIVCDTNNPRYVESRALLDSAIKVVVIDHHRRASEYIENAAVNMHEPYASSAAEIVTELLQYMLNSSKILKIEAECLLSGIMLDTKMFSAKTGSRTFEAAAYLRRIGADIDLVKSLFKTDFSNYSSIQKIKSSAKLYNEKYIISIFPEEIDRALAALSADELLNILGISATFVIFKNNNQTNISARSNSSVNVQLIMEKLGGGGSINAAACQFDSDTTENVERLLKNTIDIYDAEFETNKILEDKK